MLDYSDLPAEAAPLYSGASIVVAARGLENKTGRELSVARREGVGLQRTPLLGKAWGCEYYVDTGSRGIRSTRGVEEGFLLKASVLERCYCDGRLEERILYPFSTGSPPYLVLTGSDRQRQAAVYIAELALILALARRGEKCGGPPLVVKHGSLLQRIDVYFNPVFDMPPRIARTVLSYSTLDKPTVVDVVDWATIYREGREVASAGLLAAALLGELKRAVKEGSTVIGLSEDTSVGRHLIVEVIASIIEAHQSGLALREMVEEGLSELDRAGCLECLSDVSGGYWVDPHNRRIRLSRDVESYIEELAARVHGRGGGTTRDARTATIKKIYETQLLNYTGLSNDSAYLMVYMYLYGHSLGDGDYPVTPPHSKSELYKPLIEKSFRERIEAQRTPVSLESVIDNASGVNYRYLFSEKPPSCLDLARKGRELGVDRRLLAEIIRVRPPLRVEVFEGEKRGGEALSHIATQATTTYYGVPPQLLVVDSRSRVSEWEVTALRGLVEEISRRVVPYSTFIRDFQTRRLYVR